MVVKSMVLVKVLFLFYEDLFLIIRNYKYTPAHRRMIMTLLWLHCQAKPTTHLQGYVEHLAEKGYHVSAMYVQRIFKSWRWSFKIADVRQLQKYPFFLLLWLSYFIFWYNIWYTPENISYYSLYIIQIVCYPYDCLKFLDEASYNDRGIFFVFCIPRSLMCFFLFLFL